MNDQTCLNWFCRIAFWEGLSYIALLGIAMPIKYLMGIPEPVRYIGMAHGILFILYVLFLVLAAYRLSWPAKRVALFFVASLLPFAPFVVERNVRQEVRAA